MFVPYPGFGPDRPEPSGRMTQRAVGAIVGVFEQLRSRVVVVGVAVGAGLWPLGYLLTYAVVAGQFRDSLSAELLELIEDGAFLTEFVGWVYFNAHFVATVQELPVLGSSVTSYIGGDGFSPLLYVVPVGLLVAGGLAVARLGGATEPTTGVVCGLLLTPGYLGATLLGRTLTSVEVTTIFGSASGAPALLSAVVVGGVLYPVVFGALGGLLGAVTD